MWKAEKLRNDAKYFSSAWKEDVGKVSNDSILLMAALADVCRSLAGDLESAVEEIKATVAAANPEGGYFITNVHLVGESGEAESSEGLQDGGSSI